jgi:hypothetical protein
MKPIHRYYSIVITISALIVFAIWTISSCILTKHPEWINNQNYLYYGFAAILTYLLSYGTFKTVSNVISYLFNKCEYLKKWILSSYYVEGTWVGFYIGIAGKLRYMIETYEQTFDSIVIKGMSFDENKNSHTFWTSESVNLDIEKGEISYQYKVKSTKENTDPYGVAYFNFIRDINQAPPVEIIGYSEDAHFSKKCKAAEKKYSTRTKYDMNEALLEADIYYQSKKNIFPQINQL